MQLQWVERVALIVRFPCIDSRFQISNHYLLEVYASWLGTISKSRIRDVVTAFFDMQ